MTSDWPYRALADALRSDLEKAASNWIEAYQRSELRFPGPVDAGSLRQLVAPVLENLLDLLSPSRAAVEKPVRLRPGSPDLREVEKAVAFLGGTLAASGASCFDVAALVLSLRETLAVHVSGPATAEVAAYVEWLSVLASDSFSSGNAQAERERMRDELEDGTPVVQVVPELPSALLVGSPDVGVLDSIFGRMVLLCVRVGAPCAIVDASGLADQTSSPVLVALERFLGHRKIAGRVELLAVGLVNDGEPRWSAVAHATGCTASFYTHFDAAVQRGLSAAGYRLVRA